MNRLFYKRVNYLPAFTIVESIISLTIVGMIIMLISVVIKSIWHQQRSENELTNFHLYLRTIESTKYNFKYVGNGQNRLKLISHNKTYLIDLTSSGIRMTTDKGGYIPILDQVESVSWQYEDSFLTTRVQMTNGSHFKAVSLIESERNHK